MKALYGSFLYEHLPIILLQASTDQSEVDTGIPLQLGSFAFAIIQLLGIIAVMSQVGWQIILIFIPVIGVSFWYQVIILYVPFFLNILTNDLIGSPLQHLCSYLTWPFSSSLEILHRFCKGVSKVSRCVQSSHHTTFCRILVWINNS